MSPALRKAAATAAMLLAAALVGWRLWPRAEASAEAAAPQADADGSLRLAPSQVAGLGIALARTSAAGAVPLPGLAAQAQAPLDASQQVASPWPGTVVALLVDEGDEVRAGQPVLRLRSLEAMRAIAELARAQAEADAAQRQARRDATLLSEGIIAAARNEQSQALARGAQAEYARARDALSGARARAAGGGEIELLAPISGRVLRRSVAAGQSLAAQQDAMLIADPGRLDLMVGIPAVYRARLRPGLAVALADGGRATVVAVGADLDPASQRLRVRARFDDPATHLSGERFEVTLQLPAPDGAIALPHAALLPDGDGHVVFRRDGDRFRRVGVERLLGVDGDVAVVLAPALRPGVDVAVRGTAALKAMLPATDAAE
jgi:RND family efflux transporter MFP subunit